MSLGAELFLFKSAAILVHKAEKDLNVLRDERYAGAKAVADKIGSTPQDVIEAASVYSLLSPLRKPNFDPVENGLYLGSLADAWDMWRGADGVVFVTETNRIAKSRIQLAESKSHACRIAMTILRLQDALAREFAAR